MQCRNLQIANAFHLCPYQCLAFMCDFKNLHSIFIITIIRAINVLLKIEFITGMKLLSSINVKMAGQFTKNV